MGRIIVYGLVLFAFLLLLSSGAHALKTQITVKTEPYHHLFVQVANSDESILGKYFNKTDVSGMMVFEFSTILSLRELTFFVVTRHPITKEIVYETWFDDVPVEKEMMLNVLEEEGVGDYTLSGSVNYSAEEDEQNDSNNETVSEETTEDEQEDTVESTDELTTEKPKSSKGISGFFISEETGKLSNNVYYLGALVLVLVIVIFFFVHRRNNYAVGYSQPVPQPRPEQLSKPGGVFGMFKKPSIEQRLDDAQRKIREAQAEIRKIKEGELVDLKKTKDIEQAKIEFEKAKERLEKLTGNSPAEEKQKTQRRALTTDEAKYRRFQSRS